MTTKLKPGKLSTEDEEFIRENAVSMKVADIAAAINRRENPVRKFIESEGLASLENIQNVDEEYLEILNALKKKAFYEELKLQLDEDELKYFTAHWVDFVLQFNNDILASEYMQVRELITCDILVNRIMRKRLMAKKDIERYSKLLDDEYKKPSANRNLDDCALWESQLAQSRSAEGNLTSEQNKLQADKKELQKSLKATRDQRFSKVESGEKTFMSIIKMMYEENEREKAGQIAELIRLSTEKQKERLTDWHVYGDGGMDMPILNDESILKKKDEEKSEQIQSEQKEAN
jgi:hypothetical protein